MQRWGVCFLLLTAFALGEDLDGEIKSGKAFKLVAKAKPLLKQAFELRKKLLFHKEPQSDAYRDMVKKAISLYDKGSMLLVEALEIRYDSGVNAMLLRASRDLAKSRAALFQYRNRRRWLEEQKRKEEQAKTNPPKPEESKPEESKPEPPKREEIVEQPPPPPPKFEAEKPPAVPSDVQPQSKAPEMAVTEDEWLRRERKGIEKRIKEYFGARRKGKLRTRCKLCAGKGAFRDGTKCDACAGCGQQINLFYFRKVYWNGFTPILRDAPGALDSLKKFLAYARAQPESLGEEVATFKILAIEPHLVWARARVRLKTASGEREQAMTLVSIGSAWYFFHPATDEELIWSP